MEKVAALLPMKGNSERVKNKNIRMFAGKPLFHCIAEVLEASDYISSIIINTDSDEIASNATQHFKKVKIINRPTSIRGDFVEMNKIIEHDLSVSDGMHFLQTHSTNPLLTRQTMEDAIRRYFSGLNNYDSLMSVTRWQTRFYWASGKPVNHDPKRLLRTQDLDPLFEENSNMYIFSRTSFRNANNKRIGTTPFFFEIGKMESVDIDEEEDFQLAETLYLMQKKKEMK